MRKKLLVSLLLLLITAQVFLVPRLFKAEAVVTGQPKLDDFPQNELPPHQGENSYSHSQWSFLNPEQWRDFAKVDEDSAQVVVGLKHLGPSTISRLASLASLNHGYLVRVVSYGGLERAAVLDIALASIGAFASEVQRLGLSRYVEPNFKFSANFIPDDEFWLQQWGPSKIEAPLAWDVQLGNSTVLVAVVDTGIDYTHPDLAANYVPLGYDWVNNDTDPRDDHSHGTHVAGIIGTVINNTVGIAGLAQVGIMAEKGLDAFGGGFEDGLARALTHAADSGANIINNSWGGSFDSALIREAIQYAHTRGAVIVAAAGNSGTNTRFYPGAYPEVIGVTATDITDRSAFFTTFGDWVDLAAPGVDILSTVLGGGYLSFSGTSMASPHVAGLAALVWSQYPEMTNEAVRVHLQFRSDDLGEPGFDIYFGHGRINARKAVLLPPPEHELIALELNKPRFIIPGTKGILNMTVLNFGRSEEQDVKVQWFVNGTLTGSSTLLTMLPGTVETFSFSFQPSVEGRYNVTALIVPVPSEDTVDNNELSKIVSVGTPIIVAVLDSAGTDFLTHSWSVLNDEWFNFGNQMIYVDFLSLNKENITYADISATEADVLVLPCACGPDWEFTDEEIEAIERYTLEGHGLVGTAGTLWEGVPNNNKLGPLFGLREDITWTVSFTDLYDIIDRTHPLFRNIPDPYTMPAGPGAFPSDGAWSDNELAGGNYVALGFFREAAIVVRRGLVYISAWPDAFPSRYFFHLQLLYNAFTWSRYRPPAHDLAIRLETPRFGTPDEVSVVNGTVTNGGTNPESGLVVSLSANSSLVETRIIDSLEPFSSTTLSFAFLPEMAGLYELTVRVDPVAGEDDMINNEDSKLFFVGTPKLVLWDDSHDIGDTSLRMHYSSLESLLLSHGFIIEELVEGPITSELLANYEVVVLIDPEIDFQTSEIAAILSWAEQGGPLIAIPDTGYPSSLNTLLIPLGVRLTGRSSFFEDVTTNIRPHRITEGVRTIFHSLAWDLTALMPSVPLASTLFEGITILTATEGLRVAVISDSNIMDRRGLTRADNARLLLNMFNWVISPLPHEIAVSIAAPEFLIIGQTGLLTATVQNRGGFSEPDVSLELLINDVAVASVNLPELGRREEGSLPYSWTPVEAGRYNVTARATPVPGEESVENNLATTVVRVLSDALRVLAYVEFTDFFEEYQNSIAVIDSALNGAYFLTEAENASSLQALLPNNDVLFIPEQEYGDPAVLESIGSLLSPDLRAFLERGGTVVLTDYFYGSGGAFRMLTGAGLISITGAYDSTARPVFLVAPADPLGEGVAGTFTGPYGTIAFQTSEGRTVFSNGQDPVVIHIGYGTGNIALIGFDYLVVSPETAQILANAVKLEANPTAPPLAVLVPDGPLKINVQEKVLFDGSGSFDPNPGKRIVEYVFSVDGVVEPANSTMFSFSRGSLDTYNVCLVVTNADQLSSVPDCTSVAVNAVTRLPTAVIDGPDKVHEGYNVVYSGARSFDNSDPPQQLTYEWRDATHVLGTGVEQEITFGTPGTYLLTLTVCNESQLCNTASKTISINPAQVLADLIPPTVAYATEPTRFMISISSGSPPYTCLIDWGDNSRLFSGPCSDELLPQGVTHSFPSKSSQRNYTVTLTVTDASGSSDSDTKTVTVEPEPRFIGRRLSWKSHLSPEEMHVLIARVQNPSQYTVIVTVIIDTVRPDNAHDLAQGTFILGPGASNNNALVIYQPPMLGTYCFTATLGYEVDWNNDGITDMTGTGPNSKSGCYTVKI